MLVTARVGLLKQRCLPVGAWGVVASLPGTGVWAGGAALARCGVGRGRLGRGGAADGWCAVSIKIFTYLYWCITVGTHALREVFDGMKQRFSAIVNRPFSGLDGNELTRRIFNWSW